MAFWDGGSNEAARQKNKTDRGIHFYHIPELDGAGHLVFCAKLFV
jgi:hypothetical protein